VVKAAQACDAAGEAAVLASDAVVYREHVPPIVGPSAFQAFVTKEQATNPKAKPSWSTDTILVAEGGDLAIQTGEYHITGLGAFFRTSSSDY
jgi:ketosteroid isomerase-like protein